MKPLILSLTFLCLAVCGSLSAQVYSDQVYQQLKKSYNTLRQYGNVKLEKTIITNVTDDETDGWTFYMSSSKTYFIVGACDNDCSDLDMYITRANSSYKIREDRETNDIPVISYTPSVSGRYTITLKMYSCSASICYQGFSVYSL
ncbi:MAG: hypothetical protein AAFW73_11920 [Bacteroidota bacterium]